MLWLLACQSSQPPPVGVVRIAQESQAIWTRNFNPLVANNLSRWPSNSGIYEPLLIYNPMIQDYVPWLATTHVLAEDALSLTLNLREGVLWSDGQVFDSEDVVFTFRLLKENAGIDTHDVSGVLDSIEANGSYEVTFHFIEPAFIGIERIAHQAIVPEHVWSAVDDPVKFQNPEPVGTGPFTEISLFGNQLWQVDKNPHYWQELGVNGLQFPALPKNDTANLALLQGDIDWAGNFVPAIDRIFVEKDPEHHHYWFPLVGTSVLLYPNHTFEPLNNPLVREALSRAIDRDLLVRVALFDYTEPSDESGLSPAFDRWKMTDFEERNRWTTHSPDIAATLLDQAGWKTDENGIRTKDGKELSLKISVVSGWSDWVRAAQVISQSLSKIGINAQIDNRDFGSWYHNLSTGNFELSLGWSNDGPHPVGFYKSMLSQKEMRNVGESAGINWHRYGHPGADSLINDFEQSADESVRLDAARKLQEMFIESIPAIPLFLNPSWGAYNDKRITGFPSKENPYARLSPNHPPEHLLVLTKLRAR